ncbi:hypothetical protein SAMN05192558_112100 [Actinokineospora alba]|uniref:DUF7711 domain-containing protein n=1 Tax=Actinokineospora alba TaxID=504798 RepID=A0A1H0UVJ4_9PSEU|nr:hypothetical protein [Actinokineospora alba]TDP69028.1 hypothetical protein C8E96_4599 [Actinokineospora alba]SDI77895.1 hypothetical protein SAMN05421871_107304 [Actinokineospora alba]SDP70227.1 hypothetical protein SAMN05192558_112100 [Actinokineospora alba]
MKRIRALHHLRTVADTCADMATRPESIFPLRVRELWAAGEILEPVDELDAVTVALVVDLPVDDVAWLTEPSGSQHWANAAKLQTAPVTVRWRSARAPVWNHVLRRPALIWDLDNGIAESTLDAIGDGDTADVRVDEPSTDAMAQRLADDLAVSLRALSSRTAHYADRRWKPGKLEPVADALWHASEGYLDLVKAIDCP